MLIKGVNDSLVSRHSHAQTHSQSPAVQHVCRCVFNQSKEMFQNTGNVTFHKAICHQQTEEAVADKSKSALEGLQ